MIQVSAREFESNELAEELQEQGDITSSWRITGSMVDLGEFLDGQSAGFHDSGLPSPADVIAAMGRHQWNVVVESNLYGDVDLGRTSFVQAGTSQPYIKLSSESGIIRSLFDKARSLAGELDGNQEHDALSALGATAIRFDRTDVPDEDLPDGEEGIDPDGGHTDPMQPPEEGIDNAKLIGIVVFILLAGYAIWRER